MSKRDRARIKELEGAVEALAVGVANSTDPVLAQAAKMALRRMGWRFDEIPKVPPIRVSH